MIPQNLVSINFSTKVELFCGEVLVEPPWGRRLYDVE